MAGNHQDGEHQSQIQILEFDDNQDLQKVKRRNLMSQEPFQTASNAQINMEGLKREQEST